MSVYYTKKTAIIQTEARKLLFDLTSAVSQQNFNMELALKHIVHFFSKPRYTTPDDLVKQKIATYKEKFETSNCSEAAQLFEQQCNAIINANPTHQKNIQMLDFLFTLAYRPTDPKRCATLKDLLLRTKADLAMQKEAEQSIQAALQTPKSKSEDYVFDAEWTSIQTCSARDTSAFVSEESELSDWSSTDESENDYTSNTAASTLRSSDTQSDSYLSSPSPASDLSPVIGISPPCKPQPFTMFTEYEGSIALKLLRKNMQPSWWLQKQGQHHTITESKSLRAQFARAFQSYIRTSLKLGNDDVEGEQFEPLKSDGPSNWRFTLYKESLIPLCTVAEYCLLREILWMFFAPVTCTFFAVKPKGLIECHKNVTIPSVTRLGLFDFIENQILPYINMMSSLQSFIRSTFCSNDITLTHTLQGHAADMNLFLQPIQAAIERFERRLLHPEPMEVHTLITLQTALRDDFQQLKRLYWVHDKIRPLPVDAQPPLQDAGHIISGLILTKLYNACEMATIGEESNLCLSLLLSAMRTYCKILDTWWHNGFLNDDYNEFMLQQNIENDSLSDYTARAYVQPETAEERVPSELLKILGQNRLLDLFKQHCLGIADTITVLYNINCKKLLNFEAFNEPSLYEQLVEQLFAFVGHEEISEDAKVAEEPEHSMFGIEEPSFSPGLKPSLAIQDSDLLFMCCCTEVDWNLAVPKPQQQTKLYEMNALQIFEQLQRLRIELPLEEVLLSLLAGLLEKRAAKAHRLFMQLYLHKYSLLKNLQNISRIFMLRESYIMVSFYELMFVYVQGMEDGKPMDEEDAANIAVELTVMLQTNLGYTLPEIAERFYVQVDWLETRKPLRSYQYIDSVKLCYELNFELSQLITSSNLHDYNRIFHFLLKLKWCIYTLDNLQFPRLQRNRQPYAAYLLPELIMRRLELLRMWYMQTVQNMHFHITACIVPTLAAKLEKELCHCKTLKQLEKTHLAYLHTLLLECFLLPQSAKVLLAISQYFHLVIRLQTLWESCAKYTDSCLLTIQVSKKPSSTSIVCVEAVHSDAVSVTRTEPPLLSDEGSVTPRLKHKSVSMPNFFEQLHHSNESLSMDSLYEQRSCTSNSYSTGGVYLQSDETDVPQEELADDTDDDVDDVVDVHDEEELKTTASSRTETMEHNSPQDHCFFIQLLNDRELQLNKDFGAWYEDFVDQLKLEMSAREINTLEGLYDTFRAQRM